MDHEQITASGSFLDLRLASRIRPVADSESATARATGIGRDIRGGKRAVEQ
jgi:hypothetical protein